MIAVRGCYIYNMRMELKENKAKIKEIFSSVQGEGLYIGCEQIFIRFCACNLHCKYCDTDFYPENINDKDTFFEFSPDELSKYLKSNFDLSLIHSVSLTGGEPLIWSDFLTEFLPKQDVKFYLETNGTLAENAKKVLPYIDILASDVKLPSCSGVENSFELHDEFFKVVQTLKSKDGRDFASENNNFFSKVVFDKNITDDEIKITSELARTYDFELILQPQMTGDKPVVGSEFMMDVFHKFTQNYPHTRLIAQMHKFIGVE